VTDDFVEWLLKYEWFGNLPSPLKCFLKQEFDKYVAMGWDSILKRHEMWERERGFFGYLSGCYENFTLLNEPAANPHMEMVCWLFREAKNRTSPDGWPDANTDDNLFLGVWFRWMLREHAEEVGALRWYEDVEFPEGILTPDDL
jgi:hypothetical protein